VNTIQLPLQSESNVGTSLPFCTYLAAREACSLILTCTNMDLGFVQLGPGETHVLSRAPPDPAHSQIVALQSSSPTTILREEFNEYASVKH
jgi:hypothetical protein